MSDESKARAVVDGLIGPCCPRCGSVNGSLGTEKAYFTCRDCKCDMYWTHDNVHPGNWLVALLASPWVDQDRKLQILEFGKTLQALADEKIPSN